ncbi:protein of unknown function DUF4965 [Staphylococcus phage JPL-50]|uniref:Uncharacterized protein n=1 Tax=Staphylococcus phage JPL-50 TaxID=2851077 RepID=A0A8F3C9Q0_9CAUD|nr:protein of unknown function DUF4965 [Staphylococcus phage JPL-50]QWY14509.1 protein of unknown function DUF4965 [Staphylococcus phage JPL-50]
MYASCKSLSSNLKLTVLKSFKNNSFSCSFLASLSFFHLSISDVYLTIANDLHINHI